MPDVVYQKRHAECGPHPPSISRQHAQWPVIGKQFIQHAAANVRRAERVCVARVGRAGERKVGKPELSHRAQPLKKRGVYDGKLWQRQRNHPVHRIKDSLHMHGSLGPIHPLPVRVDSKEDG